MIQKDPENLSLVQVFDKGDLRLSIAEAKEDFLDLIARYVRKHEKEFGKHQALTRALAAFNEGRIGQEIRDKLRKKNVSRSTYYDWQAEAEGKKCKGKKGLAALICNYKGGALRIPDEVKKEVENLIWENHLARFSDLYSDLQLVFRKDFLPSYSTIRRYAQNYRKEKWAELVLRHEGSKGLRDNGLIPAIGKADANITRPNQRWEIDTTIGDLFTNQDDEPVEFITKDGKRTKLIGLIDVFSRSARYFFVERESALAVGQVLRHLFLIWGIPEVLVIDNGKPFKNHRILRFLRLLGIAVHICIPGNPSEKPFVERSFRTLSEGLFKRLSGYSGNSVKNRPREITIKYTLAEAQGIVDDFIENIYCEKIHSSTGQRPRERMAQPGFIPKKVEPRDLDILLMEEHERKVIQGCIRFQGGKFFHKDLPANQQVKFRASDFDGGEIIVFHEGSFLCVAEDFVRKGRTPRQIQEAKKEWKRELRTRIKAHEAILNRDRPKDYGINALIEQEKQNKPAELPRKAEIISFPELRDIPFSNQDDCSHADVAAVPEPANQTEQKVIVSRQAFYLDIMRRQVAGEPLDGVDKAFLEEFIQSREYAFTKTLLDAKIKSGAFQ